MTVSRALRGRPGVSPELREKIRILAQNLGYHIDPQLGRLMQHLRQSGKRGAKISLCAVTDFPSELEPKYCARLRRHAEEHAQKLGFHMSFFRVPGANWTAAQRILRARGVEGVLLLPLINPIELPLNGWESFSVVSATSSVCAPRFHEFAPNHAANARLIIDRLASLGHTKIGFVGLLPHAKRTREALLSALAWHHSQKQVRCLPLLHEPNQTPDVALWAVRENPDIILLGHPSNYKLLIANLIRAGLNQPWAFANSRAFFVEEPGLDERDDLIGIAAIDALSSLVIRGEVGVPGIPTSISITGQWIE